MALRQMAREAKRRDRYGQPLFASGLDAAGYWYRLTGPIASKSISLFAARQVAVSVGGVVATVRGISGAWRRCVRGDPMTLVCAWGVDKPEDLIPRSAREAVRSTMVASAATQKTADSEKLY
jgi:hypothetical protein